MRREPTTDPLANPGSVVMVVFKRSHGKGACFYKPGRCSVDHPSNARLAAHGVSVSISLFFFPVAHDFGRGWSWASVPSSPLFAFLSTTSGLYGKTSGVLWLLVATYQVETPLAARLGNTSTGSLWMAGSILI